MMEFDSEKYNHFVKIYRNLAKVYIFLKKVKKPLAFLKKVLYNNDCRLAVTKR